MTKATFVIIKDIEPENDANEIDDDAINDEDQEDSDDIDESVNIDPGISKCNENVNNM